MAYRAMFGRVLTLRLINQFFSFCVQASGLDIVHSRELRMPRLSYSSLFDGGLETHITAGGPGLSLRSRKKLDRDLGDGAVDLWSVRRDVVVPLEGGPCRRPLQQQGPFRLPASSFDVQELQAVPEALGCEDKRRRTASTESLEPSSYRRDHSEKQSGRAASAVLDALVRPRPRRASGRVQQVEAERGSFWRVVAAERARLTGRREVKREPLETGPHHPWSALEAAARHCRLEPRTAPRPRDCAFLESRNGCGDTHGRPARSVYVDMYRPGRCAGRIT